MIAVVIIAVITLVNPKTVSNEERQKEVSDDVAEFFRDDTSYKYDERTDLCFVHFYGFERAGFANVECTDKVKALLINPPK